MNAQTWDSYEAALGVVLDTIQPKYCLEWGSGESTRILNGYPSVMLIDTIEHSAKWYDRIRDLYSKVYIIYEPSEILYPMAEGRVWRYDLIFIDGILRERCLISAQEKLREKGVVILHDARRKEYQREIKTYPYVLWADSGNTAVMTKNEKVFKDLAILIRGKVNVKEDSNTSTEFHPLVTVFL